MGICCNMESCNMLIAECCAQKYIAILQACFRKTPQEKETLSKTRLIFLHNFHFRFQSNVFQLRPSNLIKLNDSSLVQFFFFCESSIVFDCRIRWNPIVLFSSIKFD